MNRKMGLAIYSLGHLLVDGACCLVMLISVEASEKRIEMVAAAIILYNTVAFALQPFLGFYADRKGRTNIIAFLGCLLVAVSVAFVHLPYTAAVVAGLGNAMYHIGGGTYSLNMDRKRVAYAGIFVAPGAIGLFMGAFIARTIEFREWFIFIPMIISGIAVLKIQHIPASKGGLSNTAKEENRGEHMNKNRTVARDNTALPLLLLSLVIAFRSIIGSVSAFPWKNTETLALILAVTVALGKAAGGLLSDLVGRKRTAVAALLISAPLLAFCESALLPSLVGVFLFNMTMAVTLTEIADRLFGYSGFAFGLTTLMLIFGAFFIYLGGKEFFALPWVTFAAVVLSAVMLFVSIRSGGNRLVNKEVRCNEKESVQNSL